MHDDDPTRGIDPDARARIEALGYTVTAFDRETCRIAVEDELGVSCWLTEELALDRRGPLEAMLRRHTERAARAPSTSVDEHRVRMGLRPSAKPTDPQRLHADAALGRRPGTTARLEQDELGTADEFRRNHLQEWQQRPAGPDPEGEGGRRS